MMTTREEYAEAARMCESEAKDSINHPYMWQMITKTMRQLAEGAVLCEEVEPPRLPVFSPYYRPIEEQP
jgi:hypothetical protein